MKVWQRVVEKEKLLMLMMASELQYYSGKQRDGMLVFSLGYVKEMMI